MLLVLYENQNMKEQLKTSPWRSCCSYSILGWHASFRHLAAYGGGYYTYLWARALSRRVWRHAFQSDPFSKASGERWCESVLHHGGAREPRHLIREMLAAAPHEVAGTDSGGERERGPASVAAAEDALLDLVNLDECAR